MGNAVEATVEGSRDREECDAVELDPPPVSPCRGPPMATLPRIAIRAPWIVAHDGSGHRLLRDGVVVLEGDRILQVGTRFDGRVDQTVDAADRIVTPGLISTHAHIAGSPLDRSFIEDRGNPQFYYSGLFEMLPGRSEAQDEEAGRSEGRR